MKRALQFAVASCCLLTVSFSRAQQADSGKLCALWPIYSLGEYDLFYCDYYPDANCTQEPSAEYDYLAATTTSPCPCNDCIPREGVTPRGSVGPIGPNDPYPKLSTLPQEAQRKMKVLVDPELTFIDCRDADGNPYVAKVFLLLLQTQAKNKDYKHPPRFIYVAFETTDPGDHVPGRHDIGKVERVKPEDTRFNVFRGKWTPAAADYQILFVAKN
jgi:hypothetical protein